MESLITLVENFLVSKKKNGEKETIANQQVSFLDSEKMNRELFLIST